MSNRLLQCSLCLLSFLLTFAGLGCGSSGTANLRVLHAAPTEPQVNVLVDGTTVNSNLAYTGNTGYLAVSSGSRHLQVEPVSSTTPIVDTTLSLGSSTNTTVVVTGIATFQGVVLADDLTAPTSGTAEIRLVNAAPSLAATDVYAVLSGTGISGTTPLVTGVSFGTASAYQPLTIAAGTSANYDIYFTEPGTKLALLAAPSISITSGSASTIVALNAIDTATNNVGGGFTFQILQDLQ